MAQQFKYNNKQDQVHNANSAFILIDRLISLDFQNGSIGPGDPGGPGDLSGTGGPGDPSGTGGPGGLGGQDD